MFYVASRKSKIKHAANIFLHGSTSLNIFANSCAPLVFLTVKCHI